MTLKNFVEPKLPCRAVNDLELPDCQVGFYGSLVAFDHQLGTACVIATGLGSETARAARLNARRQRELLEGRSLAQESTQPVGASDDSGACGELISNLSRNEFVARVERAQRYIRAGDVYQVNLAQRLAASNALSGWRALPAAGGGIAGAVLGVFGLRAVPDRVVVPGTFSAVERVAYPDAADQGDASTGVGRDAGRAVDLRTANEREGDGGTGDDHGPVAERPRQGMRIRLGAGA